MAERSGFFNGRQVVGADGEVLLHEDGSARLDREYTAAEFAEMFSLYLTNGIRNGGTNLMVVPDNGLFVRVLPGDAIINGYYYRLRDEGRIFQLERNSAATNRIDRIVLRLDLRQDEGRSITLALKRGNTSLVRNNEIWELGLADISVPMGFTQLTAAQISDRRLDSGVCGLINSLVSVDTTMLFSQIDTYFAQQKLLWDAQVAGHAAWAQDTARAWRGWFDQVRAELFAQVNTSYDDWARRAGFTNQAEFLSAPGGMRIQERLFNTANNATLATRTTQLGTDEVNETLEWITPSLRVNKRTTFANNRVIETITEV